MPGAFLCTMAAMVNLSAFATELEKRAARAGLKMIRRLLRGVEPTAANMAKAERLALTPGVLRKTRQGAQIRQLGEGSEGIATLVAHPKKGITVRKLYDPAGSAGGSAASNQEVQTVAYRKAKGTPTPAAGRAQGSGGVASQKLIDRKAQFAKEMQGAAGLPRFHGEAVTASGKPMHFAEYVPGKTYGKRLEDAADTIKKQRSPLPNREGQKLEGMDAGGPVMRRLKNQAEHRGYRIGDLHKDNIQVNRTGQGKLEPRAIDVVPFRRGETFPDLVDTNRLAELQAAANRGLDPHGPDRTKRLMREAFTKQP